MPPGKAALVLLTFGSTRILHADPLDILKKEIRSAHPDMEILTAYSSAHVAEVLRSKGQQALNLSQALSELAARGCKHAAVQSMHVIPGYEYDFARETALRFAGIPKGLEKTAMGLPLIASHKDAAAAASCLLKEIPPQRKTDEAVIFVGHGTDHPAGSLAYPALQFFLGRLAPLSFVGTIEGQFNPAVLIELLGGQGVRKVWLAPLLTMLGEHARNDIFGSAEKSWAKILEREGFNVEPLERGLFENPGLVSIWVDHAEAALEALDS